MREACATGAVQDSLNFQYTLSAHASNRPGKVVQLDTVGYYLTD